MMRVLFVPQFPTELRYSEWWFTEFPKQFRKRGFEVLTLGEKYVNLIKNYRSSTEMFSPIDEAIEFETEQINEYMSLDIKSTDILFVSDISFPGLFCNTLFHKRCPKMYAFCHATSINHLDYFAGVAQYKFPVESEHASMFNKVFVGSLYHQLKLQWPNTMITYLPFQPHDGIIEKFTPKKHLVMSASRPTPQKVDLELEKQIEEVLDTKIYRPVSNTWKEYFENLRASNFLLVTAQEDTFGYQIVDAVTNNCIPLARNSLSYPELLPREYLYNDFDDFVLRYDCLECDEGQPEVPTLLCKNQMHDFYDIICKEMKNGR